MLQEVEMLADWQNLLIGWRKSTGSRGYSEIDAYEAVQHVVQHARAATTPFSSATTVQATVWLYGSGIDNTTHFGSCVRKELNAIRITEPGLRITMNPVDRPVHLEAEPLQVALCPYDAPRTCRVHGCTTLTREQKLADTMIVADAGHFGTFPSVGLAIISDDEDMVPGLLLAAHFRRIVGGAPAQELLWYRPSRPVAKHRAKYARHFMMKGSES